MEVNFNPVKITIFKEPNVIQKLLYKIDPATYGQFETDPQTIIFLCKSTAKTVMRRLNKTFPLQKGETQHSFMMSKMVEDRTKDMIISIPIPSYITRMKRKSLPKYIHVSLDGKLGFRCLTRGNQIYFNGSLTELSGRMWKDTKFYCLI